MSAIRSHWPPGLVRLAGSPRPPEPAPGVLECAIGHALATSIAQSVSPEAYARPRPAMVIGCAGLLVLIGTRSVNGPAPDGGPSTFRVLKTHVALLAIPVVVLFPAAALLIPGTITHSPLLRWLAVLAAIAGAAFLSWRSTGPPSASWKRTARRSSRASAPQQASSPYPRTAGCRLAIPAAARRDYFSWTIRAFQVAGPTMPLAASPNFFWKSRTAVCVRGPNAPSTARLENP